MAGSFQQLIAPNITAGTSAIMSGLSSVANVLANQQRNRASLINTLLGQAGQGLREKLQANRELDELQFKEQLPSTQAEILSRSLGSLEKGADFITDPSQANQLAGAAQQLLGLTGGGNVGTGMQSESLPGAQDDSGSFRLGVSSGSSTGIPLFLQERQSQLRKRNVDTESKVLSNKRERQSQQFIDAFAKDVDNNNAQVTSLTGQPIKGLENTAGLQEEQKQIAFLATQSPGKLSDLIVGLKEGSDTVGNVLRKINQIDGLIGEGVRATVERAAGTNDLVINVTGDPKSAKLKALIKSLDSDLSVLARLKGQKGTLTDLDVDVIRQALPQALSNKEVFNAQKDEFARSFVTPVLRDAARLRNKAVFERFEPEFKKLTGQGFDFDLVSSVDPKQTEARTLVRGGGLLPDEQGELNSLLGL